MSAATHEVHLHDPQTLYRHWEESQWSPWDIDLSIDRDQWAAIDDRSLAEKDVPGELDAALRAAQQGPSLHLLVIGGDVYRDVAVEYRGGPRHPQLERIAGQPDLLSRVAALRRTR